MENKVLSKEAKNDEAYMAYLRACHSGDSKVEFEDLDSNQYPRSYEHFYRKDASEQFKNKWHKQNKVMEDNLEKKTKTLEGEMKYQIIVGDDVDIRFEQSNENNLVAFVAVEKLYAELWAQQVNPSDPSLKMNKNELKELQISKEFLRKHIAALGKFVQNKYKNAVPEKEKPVIIVPSALDTKDMIDKKLKFRK